MGDMHNFITKNYDKKMRNKNIPPRIANEGYLVGRLHAVWFIRDTVKKRLCPSLKFEGILTMGIS